MNLPPRAEGDFIQAVSIAVTRRGVAANRTRQQYYTNSVRYFTGVEWSQLSSPDVHRGVKAHMILDRANALGGDSGIELTLQVLKGFYLAVTEGLEEAFRMTPIAKFETPK